MFILTDGKSYVMENPMKPGFHLATTNPNHAKKFTFKSAKTLAQSTKKSLSWIKNFDIVDEETGEIVKGAKNYKGNGGCYIGKNDIDFDESIITMIYDEAKSIIGLAGWSMTQLKTYEEALSNGLSKYDSAESDIAHALQKYREDNNGKKAQAHKMAKISYLLDEVRDKHKHIKQCLDYVRVMQDAITYNYPIDKLKLELTKAKHTEYKGRTEYYKLALEILS